MVGILLAAIADRAIELHHTRRQFLSPRRRRSGQLSPAAREHYVVARVTKRDPWYDQRRAHPDLGPRQLAAPRRRRDVWQRPPADVGAVDHPRRAQPDSPGVSLPYRARSRPCHPARGRDRGVLRARAARTLWSGRARARPARVAGGDRDRTRGRRCDRALAPALRPRRGSARAPRACRAPAPRVPSRHVRRGRRGVAARGRSPRARSRVISGLAPRLSRGSPACSPAAAGSSSRRPSGRRRSAMDFASTAARATRPACC
jgi:hypothetical protein